MRGVKTYIAVALPILFAGTGIAAAQQYETGSSFIVVVGSETKPRANVKTKLSNAENEFLKVSDESGRIFFNSVPPGEYVLETVMLDENSAVAVKVLGSDSQRVLALRYPDSEPLKTRALTGSVEVPAYLLPVELKIMNQSGKSIGKIESFAGGVFDVRTSEPGLYFIEFDRNGERLGTVPVDVDDHAKKSQLAFEVAESFPKGLSYEELCDLGSISDKLVAPAACFLVQDSTGAAIPESTVTLRNNAAQIKSTDADGRVEFPNLLPGIYQLEVSKPYFLTTQKELTVTGVDCKKVIEVSLGTTRCGAHVKLVDPPKSIEENNATSH
jgi:hypothetical protein